MFHAQRGGNLRPSGRRGCQDIATAKLTTLAKQASFLQGIGGKGTVVGAPDDSVPLWAVVDGTAHELTP